MKLITRTYRPDDFKSVESIWNSTGMGGAHRGDTQYVISKTIDLGGQLFILEDADTSEIIGTSWLTQDGRRIYLHHFGIKPGYQSRGFSKPLLEASLDFAKQTGLQIKLEVHKTNTIARDLYKKAGFKYLGDYDVYIIRNYNLL